MRLFDRVISFAVVACLLLSVGVLAFSTYHFGNGALTWQKGLVGFVIPSATALGAWMTLRVSLAARRLIALYAFCCAISVYAAQAFLLFRPAEMENSAAALGQKLGLPVDPRTKREVIDDLRSQGKDAWPAVVTTKYLTSPIEHDGRSILPLSGISRVLSVNCNEFGTWMIYPADEHGFNNPLGLWQRQVHILAIGDSFVHGACEPPGKDLVSVLRESEPATLNIGIGGRGPLMELATFIEYAPTVRPALTLWFYYDGNDLVNLADERNREILMRYLRQDFSQGLINQQDAIDTALKQLVNQAASGDFRKSARAAIVDFILLRPLRATLGLNATGTVEVLTTVEDYLSLIPLFKETMTKAVKLAQSWNGKIVFVYLPSLEMLVDPKHIDTRQAVLNAARDSGLEILDLTAAFKAEDAAATRFWYGPGTHYSAEGYRFVAESVSRSIAQTKDLR
ncbi:MAG: hypothetical protein HQL44_04935 [Alphaproteobacteria bacterium]|nr:hypothetical protein [Alphaproteobacteria bacterium]